MNKVLLQFSVLVILFVGTWFLLSNIDFVKRLHVKKTSEALEKKLGNLLMDNVTANNKEIETDSVQVTLDTIKNRLCIANGIDPKDIHLHLIKSDVVNAFALPGNHIVIYTGLIKRCDSSSELCGVLSHEISHLQLHHVMKRLTTEIGIGVLATVASNGNSAVVAQIIKTLSSSAFARKQESEADANGVIYLEKAHISPAGFVNIMNKLAKLQEGMPKAMEWISSHPDSKARAETILQLSATYHNAQSLPVVTDDEWSALKEASDVTYVDDQDDDTQESSDTIKVGNEVYIKHKK